MVKLKKISEQITTGKTPPTKDPSNYGNKMPFVTIPDMHDNVFVTETERMLSSKGIQTQKNKVVQKLFSCELYCYSWTSNINFRR